VDPDFIRELFAVFGPVRLRRMFFGIGIFADGRMFGCAVGGLIHLKTDDMIVADFAVEQSGPFLYPTKGGMRTLRSYWRLPERLYDDPEELALWARRSLEAARRAAARPRAAKPSGSSHLPIGEHQEFRVDLANDPIAAVVLGGVEARVDSLDSIQ
jgi:DNA transformation protein and related proteins